MFKKKLTEERLAEALYLSGKDPWWKAWAALLDDVQTGNPAAEQTHATFCQKARAVLAYLKEQ